MITGANGGGKTTFLRSVGVAHLMMQSGMFVTARALTASVTGGLHTHFRREEDHAMASGKLEEELIRMSAVADALHPGDLLLCNESFMSTNEREGSTIAAEIVQALTDSGVRVLFVTHLHDFAHRMLTERPARSLFLLAARGENGQRPFRLTPGAPHPPRTPPTCTPGSSASHWTGPPKTGPRTGRPERSGQHREFTRVDPPPQQELLRLAHRIGRDRLRDIPVPGRLVRGEQRPQMRVQIRRPCGTGPAGTITAATCSPQSGSGTPRTAAPATPG